MLFVSFPDSEPVLDRSSVLSPVSDVDGKTVRSPDLLSPELASSVTSYRIVRTKFFLGQAIQETYSRGTIGNLLCSDIA